MHVVMVVDISMSMRTQIALLFYPTVCKFAKALWCWQNKQKLQNFSLNCIQHGRTIPCIHTTRTTLSRLSKLFRAAAILRPFSAGQCWFRLGSAKFYEIWKWVPIAVRKGLSKSGYGRINTGRIKSAFRTIKLYSNRAPLNAYEFSQIYILQGYGLRHVEQPPRLISYVITPFHTPRKQSVCVEH